MEGLDSRGDSHNFLNVLATDKRCDNPSSRAGKCNTVVAGLQPRLIFHRFQKFARGSCLARIVTKVSFPDDLAVVLDHSLNGGGSDI